MRYRAEIDGLRAVAVVPVIFFHAGLELFSGGYVGVDVFFVISGYLITTLIVNALDRGDFSIARFYERRARRILPALLLVVLASLPFAWAWLTPSDMRGFAAGIVGLATFSSNFVLWQQSGYFDTGAELNPLLHSWSLAVEEQFYVLFPVFLCLVWRFGKSLLFPLIGMLFVSSLLLGEWAVGSYPDAAFFLLPTRGWELLLGALCALTLRRPGPKLTGLGANAASLGGLGLVAFAVFSFDRTTPTPSLATLIPTAGTALVILGANRGTIAHSLLSTRPAVAVGLVSYSAYLWHQPIIAFFRVRFGTELDIRGVIFCVALAFLLAIVSWRFVEQPFRHGMRIGTRPVLTISFVALATLSAVGAVAIAMDGFRDRFDRKFLEIVDEGESRPTARAILGAEEGPFEVAVLGDSHANALLDALEDALLREGISAHVLTKNGCPPAYGLWRHDLPFRDSCNVHYTKVFKKLQATPSVTTVVVSARFALYLNSVRFDNREGGVESGATPRVIYDTIAHRDNVRPLAERRAAIEDGIVEFAKSLSELGLRIYVITSVPEVGWNVPHVAGQRYLLGKDGELTTQRDVYEQRVAPVDTLFTRLDALPGVTLVDASQPFCDGTVCFATQNGIPLYHDSNHLSRTGARRLVDFLSKTGFLN
ncbi:MAG: acyltransferase family protein [Myxococcota bacterium]